VRWIDRRDTARCTDGFDRDGRSYQMSGDRIAWMDGSFEVRHSFYVVIVRRYFAVKALFKGPGHRYLESIFSDGRWSKGVPVTVRNSDPSG
jgi:hypothetical protein